MISSQLKRVALNLVALAALASASAAFAATQPPPAPGKGQGTVRSTHGAWSIICDTPAGASKSNAR